MLMSDAKSSVVARSFCGSLPVLFASTGKQSAQTYYHLNTAGERSKQHCNAAMTTPSETEPDELLPFHNMLQDLNRQEFTFTFPNLPPGTRFSMNFAGEPQNAVPPAAPFSAPDASMICAQIPILAKVDVTQAILNRTTIAPAAEMTLKGLEDSAQDAFYALGDIYIIAYQRVLEGVDPPILKDYKGALTVTISNIVDLCAHLGAYQATKDMEADIEIDEGELVTDLEDEDVSAKEYETANKAVRSYYEACASHRLWQIDNAERCLLWEAVVKIERVEIGLRLVMQNKARHILVEPDVTPAQWSMLQAKAEEYEQREVREGTEAKSEAERQPAGSRKDYPAVNASTASERVWG